jgi:hypothetical protein
MNDPPVSTSHSFSRELFWALLRLLFLPLIVAFVSYVCATLDNSRKEHLEHVRGEIVNLYGPLCTLSTTVESVWNDLSKKHMPNFDNIQTQPSNDEIIFWRNLLKNVVAPLNDRVEQTLLSSKQTVRCSTTRDALHDFFAFAESVKLVTGTWKANENFRDRTRRSREANYPDFPYPKDLSKILCAELVTLHEREKILDNGLIGLLPLPEEPSCERKQ